MTLLCRDRRNVDLLIARLSLQYALLLLQGTTAWEGMRSKSRALRHPDAFAQKNHRQLKETLIAR
jgi:hypothetical protein